METGHLPILPGKPVFHHYTYLETYGVARKVPSPRGSRKGLVRLREISRKPLPFGGYDERLWQAFRA